MTEEDIKDRSKSDAMTKLLAILQSGWLIIQSIARVAVGLAITELELTTMAFVFCALITYVLWWDKPFNAERAIVFASSNPQQPIALSYDRHSHDSFNQWHTVCNGELHEELTSSFSQSRTEEFSVDIMKSLVFIDVVPPGSSTQSMIVLYIAGAIFSAIHLTAWNWEFPSPLVQTLWRCSSVVALGLSLSPVLAYAILLFIARYMNVTTLAIFLLWSGLAAYALSRLMLIAITLYCFTSMPADAYTLLDWSKFFPHFS